MVGDKVHEDDKNWQHYITTLQIANYLLAQPDYLNVIRIMKCSYNSILMHQSSPKCTISYKFPILCLSMAVFRMCVLKHGQCMCTCINTMPTICFCLRFGPLVHYWTMRYKARHHFFKCLAQNIGNVINLSYTLATTPVLLPSVRHLS